MFDGLRIWLVIAQNVPQFLFSETTFRRVKCDDGINWLGSQSGRGGGLEVGLGRGEVGELPGQRYTSSWEAKSCL